MSTEKVGLEVEIKGGGQVKQEVQAIETSVKSFRQQLREANQELVTAVQKFGATSKEAAHAAKEVAELKEAMSKAKTLTDAYHPDEKFKSLSIALQGASRGFEAFQGAMGLVGAGGEDLEKTLVKIQGAMAFADGLNNLLAMQDSFTGLASVIKGGVVSAFTTLRGALIATGIGALAVALGAIIANFDEVKAKVIEMFPALGKVGELFEDIKKRVSGFASATVQAFKDTGVILKDFFTGNWGNLAEDARKMGENIGRAYKEGFQKEANNILNQKAMEEIVKQADELERRIKVAKAGGKDVEKDEQQLAALRIAAMKKGSKEYLDAIATEQARQAAYLKQLRDKQAEKDKKGQEDAEKERKARMKRLKDAGLLTEDDVAEHGRLSGLAAQQTIQNAQNIRVSTKQIGDARVQEEAGISLAAINVAEYEKEAKLATLNAVMTAMDAFADLAGRNTAAGKAIAVATTTISTYVSAAKAFEGMVSSFPGPWGIAAGVAAAAGVVISGISRVKSILAVQVPRGGGVSGSVPTVSSAGIPSSASTVQNQVQQQVPVKINADQVNKLGDRGAVRAYIVDADIQNAEKRNQRIERASILGG